jgi:hypothetical protein
LLCEYVFNIGQGKRARNENNPDKECVTAFVGRFCGFSVTISGAGGRADPMLSASDPVLSTWFHRTNPTPE